LSQINVKVGVSVMMSYRLLSFHQSAAPGTCMGLNGTDGSQKRAPHENGYTQ
jgi:hypothetical protein